MDENEKVEVEEEIDMSGWDDEDDTPVAEESEEEETTPEAEDAEETETETEDSEETEEPKADQPEEKPETEEPQTEQEKPEEPKAEVFTLKHLGETKEFSREETVTLAQKGLDYDRIRQERDALKAESPKLKDYETFLGEVAESAGVTIDKLIEDIRTKALVDRESKAGRPLSDAAAREQIQKERNNRLKASEPEKEPEKQEEKPKNERDERKRADLQKFAMSHPDIKGTDIPQEVWQEFRDSDSTFEDIYTRRVTLPKVTKELEELKKKLSAAETNAKNTARSAGSRKSAGAGRAIDPAFAGWDD